MIPILLFIMMLLLGLAVLLLSLVWIMSQMLIAPSRMSDAKAVYLLKRLSPGDLQMHFEEVSFQVRDERTTMRIKIAGWWIPCRKDEDGKMKHDIELVSVHPSSLSHQTSACKTVILLHGFADAKVGAIAWAPLWQSLGYNILAIDLRAHGESGGRFTTAGFYERHDLDQVINELRASKPHETQEVVLFGISLGAAVAAVAAERRDDLRAVILDSPYHHYAAAAISHARYMNLPFGFLAPIAIRLGQWRSGVSYDEVAPAKTLRSARCPVMIVLGEQDPLVSVDEVASIERVFEGRAGGSRVVRIPDAGHVLGIVADGARYRKAIEIFLNNSREEKQ